jgi:hypothetical protein
MLCIIIMLFIGSNCDIVAEWLRRWIANPLLFERASSNLADVDSSFVRVTPDTCWEDPSSFLLARIEASITAT